MLIVLLMRKSHPLLETRQQILGQASNLNVSQTSGEISLSATHEHGRFTISYLLYLYIHTCIHTRTSWPHPCILSSVRGTWWPHIHWYSHHTCYLCILPHTGMWTCCSGLDKCRHVHMEMIYTRLCPRKKETIELNNDISIESIMIVFTAIINVIW